MAIHFRPTPLLAMIGVLALGSASAAGAQDTSAASRADTSGYQPYQNRTDSTQVGKDSTRTDSSGFRYNGPPTDTTLKAEPGAQTGPSKDSTGMSKDSTGISKDSGSAAAPSGMSAADSVVCKDGSNEGNRGGVSCGSHGGDRLGRHHGGDEGARVARQVGLQRSEGHQRSEQTKSP